MQQILSVKQLNTYVKSLLESDVNLLSCRVQGEITNFKEHFSSGHLYFTLNDGNAAIKCVMFRGNAIKNRFKLKDGISVICNGRVSIYEKDGNYQLYVETVTQDGEGDKLLALKQLIEKLTKEGLLDISGKRKPHKFPRRIAVVTSGTGAALQDIINVVSRRYPVCDLIVCPAGVQGEGAANEMISVLDRVYEFADDIDTIIIGRGGGSSEDLSAFNDEALARKIYSSPIPVISAVGHQTDTSICDLVADLRAPTPSAAAELAVPDKEELLNYITNISTLAGNVLKQKYELSAALLSAIKNNIFYKYPEKITENKSLYCDNLLEKCSKRIETVFDKKSANFMQLVARVEALNPLSVLTRGYSVAEFNGKSVVSVSDMNESDVFKLTVSDGKYNCIVKDKE